METRKYIRHTRSLLSDWLTPISAYMLLRKKFAQLILLEGNDFHYRENSRSFVCCAPLFGIRAGGGRYRRITGAHVEEDAVNQSDVLIRLKEDFKSIRVQSPDVGIEGSGFFGHFAFEAVRYFDKVKLPPTKENDDIRLDFYRYVLVFDHARHQLTLIEHCPDGESDTIDSFITFLQGPLPATYSFTYVNGPETGITDGEFEELVRKGIRECKVGNTFQIVLSRAYHRKFTGDDLHVYRYLRKVNPSPYLFYFDYGDYRLFGSSPETQLIVSADGIAEIRPIAGTYARTGDDTMDLQRAEELAQDPKESAEHVMLVDLARNDLNRMCQDVHVASYREIQYLSHVIHLVSRVQGQLRPDVDTLDAFALTFPAGTLSGAPKIQAMETIGRFEPHARGFYGGALGYFGLDGSINTAILIRTFRSMSRRLTYQAGAGIVVDSVPAKERMEVSHKLAALEEAVVQAAKNKGI